MRFQPSFSWTYYRLFSVSLLIVCFSCRTQTLPSSTSETSKMTIAFGSCNHQWQEEQPMWKEIVKNSPDLWIWLGDIIYADTEDMNKMADDYRAQKFNVDYNYLDAAAEVIGIWDDHDYGSNNAGKEFSKKDSSKILLFDFLNVPKNHPARQRDGAYQANNYKYGDLSVKVILLDVRYFRDQPSENGTILGPEQWSWFEQQLKESEADVHIIGGGIQFLPEDHRFEKWANFPKERIRLLQVIDKYNVRNPILLSGDRHLAEMSLVKTPKDNMVIEVTSSGLTHSYRQFTKEKNRHRIGEVTPVKNFGLLTIEKTEGEIFYRAEIRNEINQVLSTYRNY